MSILMVGYRQVMCLNVNEFYICLNYLTVLSANNNKNWFCASDALIKQSSINHRKSPEHKGVSQTVRFCQTFVSLLKFN